MDLVKSSPDLTFLEGELVIGELTVAEVNELTFAIRELTELTIALTKLAIMNP